MKNPLRMVLTLLPLWLPLDTPRAEVATLFPVADTSLFELNPDNNLGASTALAVGTTAGVSGAPARSRSLIQFDVAATIPPNAIISSATLTVTVTKTPNPTRVDSAFAIHRVLRTWGEGTKNGDLGAPATTGEATWRMASFTPSPSDTDLWSTPGGLPGTDYAAQESAAAPVSGVGLVAFQSTTNLVADVQSWLENPGSNSGWILLSKDEATARTARRLASREWSNPEQRPRLVIEFSVPAVGPAFAMESMEKSPAGFQFKFTANAGSAYTVEFSGQMPPGVWMTLTNYPPLAVSRDITLLDGSMTNTPLRFYRMRRE